MVRYIPFAKMSGAGNDFVLIDDRQQLIVHADRAARALCDRRRGIGADGLLLVEKSATADFMMKYYNADGTSGGMCGNGGRCIAMFAYREYIVPGRVIRFEALGYEYRAEIVDGIVILSMKDPVEIGLNNTLTVEGLDIRYHVVDTGTAHCVVLIDENPGLLGMDFEHADIRHLGSRIRHHEAFAPYGTNVNFIQKREGNVILQRTYERGVEDETLACGTGSVASSVIMRRLKAVETPVTVRVRSGEDLRVDFSEDPEGRITGVTLEGSARIVYEGTVIYDTENDTIK